MTKREFERAYLAARRSYSKLTRETLVKVKEIYEQAAAKVSQIVALTEAKELSSLTSAINRQLNSVLEQAAKEIRDQLDDGIKNALATGSSKITDITEKYLVDLVGISEGKITQSGIVNMFIGVDKKLVESIVNRVYQGGYTFSDRIWRVGERFQKDIKNVISVGLASGRDAIDIARDIQVYVKQGRRALATRYGDLVGSEFRKRIHKSVDYNALRLVRSELYQSLQDASVLSGEMNPASQGLYDWVRNTSEDWNCECPELEANGPYEADEIPEYPHPNCLCTIRPRLMDSKEFTTDLKEWVRSGDSGYIQDWYDKYYLNA